MFDYSEDFFRAVKFIEKLSPDDSVCVIHHDDMDGVGSGVIAIKALRDLKFENIKAFTSSIDGVQEVIDENSDCDVFLALDLAVRELDIPKDSKCLHIDHHPTRSDTSSDNIVHYNPALETGNPYQPGAYLTYKVFAEVADIEKYEWIAAMGCIGDYAFEDVRDVMDNWIEVEEKDDMFDTELGTIEKMISSSLFELEFNDVRDILLESETPEDVKSHEKLIKAYETFSEEFERCKREYNHSVEKVGNVKIGKIKSKYKGIASNLATAISINDPENIYIVAQKHENAYKISGRAQFDGIDLGSIFHESTKGIGAGGGHKRAAGAKIKHDKFDVFKERVLEQLKEFTEA